MESFPTWVQALSAFVIAMLAFFTFRLNRSLAQDNRRLIETQLEPQVVVYLAQEKENGSECVFVNVENIGRGPAQNVRGGLNAPGEGTDKYIYNRLMERAQAHFIDLRFLPSGARVRKLIVNRETERTHGTPPPIIARMVYENLRGKLYEHDYELDVQDVSAAWNLSRPS